MPIAINDGFDNFIRQGSTQSTTSAFSFVQKGVVTRIDSSTSTAYVRVRSLNENAELGPFPCMRPFTVEVETPVKQTLNVTTGGGYVTSVSLSSTTTDIAGVYGSLSLPAVGDNVVVVFANNSLDEGIILGKLPW